MQKSVFISSHQKFLFLRVEVPVYLQVLALREIIFMESDYNLSNFAQNLLVLSSLHVVVGEVGCEKELAGSFLFNFNVMLLLNRTVSETHRSY